jgi:hypothetical protein
MVVRNFANTHLQLYRWHHDIQHNDTYNDNDIRRKIKLYMTLSITALSKMVERCHAQCQLC